MKTLTTDRFIQSATNTHGHRYDYSKANYVNGRTKIEILCRLHGEFLQTPRNHVFNKQGCPSCGMEASHVLTRNSIQDFVSNASKIHNNFYDYSKVEYRNINKKTTIICPIHGEFSQTPYHHLNKQGCPLCRHVKSGISRTKSNDAFIIHAKSVHGIRYDYSKTHYKNCKKRVVITCKLHGDFLQHPTAHIKNSGCPKCGMFISKAEYQIGKFLEKNSISYDIQKTFDTCRNPKTNYKLRYDFYIPAINTLIEYDGEQHFKVGAKLGGKHITSKEEFDEIRFRDSIKTKWSSNNKIRLIRISYKDNITETLRRELLVT